MEIQEVRVSRPEQFFHLIIFKTHMSLDKTLRFDIAGSIRHMKFVLTMNLVTRKGPPPVKEMSLCLQSESCPRAALLCCVYCVFMSVGGGTQRVALIRSSVTYMSALFVVQKSVTYRSQELSASLYPCSLAYRSIFP